MWLYLLQTLFTELKWHQRKISSPKPYGCEVFSVCVFIRNILVSCPHVKCSMTCSEWMVKERQVGIYPLLLLWLLYVISPHLLFLEIALILFQLCRFSQWSPWHRMKLCGPTAHGKLLHGWTHLCAAQYGLENCWVPMSSTLLLPPGLRRLLRLPDIVLCVFLNSDGPECSSGKWPSPPVALFSLSTRSLKFFRSNWVPPCILVSCLRTDHPWCCPAL